ncbi:hypothetical protein ACFL2Q_15050 [Thermodesulfobacteriota bacterium]
MPAARHYEFLKIDRRDVCSALEGHGHLRAYFLKRLVVDKGFATS